MFPTIFSSPPPTNITAAFIVLLLCCFPPPVTLLPPPLLCFPLIFSICMHCPLISPGLFFLHKSFTVLSEWSRQHIHFWRVCFRSKNKKDSKISFATITLTYPHITVGFPCSLSTHSVLHIQLFALPDCPTLIFCLLSERIPHLEQNLYCNIDL